MTEMKQACKRYEVVTQKCLSGQGRYAILGDGEMSEWSNVPLSKSGRVNSPRGFESHSLRHPSHRGWEPGGVS